MEKELRNSYCLSFPIVLFILYFLLKKEGGTAMGVLIVFIVTSIPFISINVGRYFKKIKKTTEILSVIYILFLGYYSIVELDKEDSLIIEVETLLLFFKTLLKVPGLFLFSLWFNIPDLTK